MSLKSIEMQIAIPRTNEVKNVQNQLQQKPAFDQFSLAENAAKRTENARQKSAEIEETTYQNVRDDGSASKGGGRSRSGRQKKQPEPKSVPQSSHPYKGKYIDISL